MSFATNLYPGDYFEGKIGVNLTVLLVLVTMFIGVTNELPKVHTHILC